MKSRSEQPPIGTVPVPDVDRSVDPGDGGLIPPPETRSPKTRCAICGRPVSLDPYGPAWVHTYPRWHILAADGHAAELSGKEPE